MARPIKGYRQCPSCGGQSPVGLNTCIHCKASLAEGQRPREPEFDLAAFRWRVLLVLGLLTLFAAAASLAGHWWVTTLLLMGIVGVAVGAMLVVEHECPDSDRGFIGMIVLLFFGGS